MSKEAMTLALEALGYVLTPHGGTRAHVWDSDEARIVVDAYKALEEALAKQEHDCTRSHPHEEMSKECELRTEIARLTNKLANIKQEQGEPVAKPTAEMLVVFKEAWKGGSIWTDRVTFALSEVFRTSKLYTTPQPKQEQRSVSEQLGKPVIGMLEPIGILMKLEGDKHLKIYGMDEQLEQKPVATEEKWDGTLHKGTIRSEKLITSQPAQKPLTDEQIYDMYNEPRSDAEMLAFARAIEAAHGIKENT
jgi:hypothetical protein